MYSSVLLVFTRIYLCSALVHSFSLVFYPGRVHEKYWQGGSAYFLGQTFSFFWGIGKDSLTFLGLTINFLVKNCDAIYSFGFLITNPIKPWSAKSFTSNLQGRVFQVPTWQMLQKWFSLPDSLLWGTKNHLALFKTSRRWGLRGWNFESWAKRKRCHIGPGYKILELIVIFQVSWILTVK